MDINEAVIDRWLARGSRFFKAVSRNSVVREVLVSRGLTDEELQRGWSLFAELHGFGAEQAARPARRETSAAQAINEIDAWDAPAYATAHAVLDARLPAVSRYLFDNLAAAQGPVAVVGVERFLDRVAALRDGKAPGVDPEQGRQAAELLATRKVLDAKREAELRALIATARLGARPEEVVPAAAVDARRQQLAKSYIDWLHEWREVARSSIVRRDYQITLGIAQRRQSEDDAPEAAESSTAEGNRS